MALMWAIVTCRPVPGWVKWGGRSPWISGILIKWRDKWCRADAWIWR